MSSVEIAQTFACLAQLPTKIVAGRLLIDDGALTPRKQKYGRLADGLDKMLLTIKSDTSILFERALLLNLSNDQLAKPAAGERLALMNLLWAKGLI